MSHGKTMNDGKPISKPMSKTMSKTSRLTLTQSPSATPERSSDEPTRAVANAAEPSDSDRAIWNTKYGPRRVRHDPPTLEEAIAAAAGLSDSVQDQVEIAASLMNLPEEQVRAAVLRAKPGRKEKTIAFTQSRSGGPRAVVVERKTPRRIGQIRTFGF